MRKLLFPKETLLMLLAAAAGADLWSLALDRHPGRFDALGAGLNVVDIDVEPLATCCRAQSKRLPIFNQIP